MRGPNRLGCGACDREDFDGVEELPSDWLRITLVQSLGDSYQEVDQPGQASKPFAWYTHLGTCPECQAEEQ